NKVIGENNIITDIYHVYKAWYKGKKRVEFGREITSKTDIGDYIIQDDGDITAYAQESVELYPGFDAQYGSDFHAYIDEDSFCESSSRIKESNSNTSLEETMEKEVLEPLNLGNNLSIYPNPTDGELVIMTSFIQHGFLEVLDMQGKMVYSQRVSEEEKVLLDLSAFRKGVYLVRIYNDNQEKKGKVIIK
ncbi:MAG: T9SS type A sorting domain-containing protein, partial [Flavobacteriales bacterium]|nr:T9SS type A sorting domain-containing protein [Flavobacteriales bacterium]